MESQVIVFTDFSAEADVSLDKAIKYSIKNNCEIFLVHVLEELKKGSIPLVGNLSELQNQISKKKLSERSYKVFKSGISCCDFMFSQQNWELKLQNNWINNDSKIFIGKGRILNAEGSFLTQILSLNKGVIHISSSPKFSTELEQEQIIKIS